MRVEWQPHSSTCAQNFKVLYRNQNIFKIHELELAYERTKSQGSQVLRNIAILIKRILLRKLIE